MPIGIAFFISAVLRMVLSLCDGHVVALVGTDVPLTRTADLLFFVVQKLLHV
jgi:hypothetical protein